MGHNFTQRECIRSLLKIGFVDVSKRRSKHFKYKPTQEIVVNYRVSERSFVTIPKHKFFCQDAIVSEIGKMCGEKIKQDFLDNLK